MGSTVHSDLCHSTASLSSSEQAPALDRYKCNPRDVWDQARLVSVTPGRQNVQSSQRNLFTRVIFSSGKARAMLEVKTVSMHAQSVVRDIRHSSVDLYTSNESPLHAVSSALYSRNHKRGQVGGFESLQRFECWRMWRAGPRRR